MSLMPRQRVEKHCFVACPPEHCNCMAGVPLEEQIWIRKQREEDRKILEKLLKEKK